MDTTEIQHETPQTHEDTVHVKKGDPIYSTLAGQDIQLEVLRYQWGKATSLYMECLEPERNVTFNFSVYHNNHYQPRVEGPSFRELMNQYQLDKHGYAHTRVKIAATFRLTKNGYLDCETARLIDPPVLPKPAFNALSDKVDYILNDSADIDIVVSWGQDSFMALWKAECEEYGDPMGELSLVCFDGKGFGVGLYRDNHYHIVNDEPVPTRTQAYAEVGAMLDRLAELLAQEQPD